MWRKLVGWGKRAARRRGIGLYRPGQEWRLAEPAQLERFLQYFAVDCVFDIGANTGQYAAALRALGYTGQILSFEPNPEVVKQLRIAAAADARWEVFDVALDAEVRDLEFNVMEASQFSSLREPDHSGTDAFVDTNRVSRRIALTTQTLAEVYPGMQARFGFARPFLKMDTQGHDLEVVKGAGDCLCHFVGLQSELSLTRLYEDAPDFAEALIDYRARGFKLSALVPNNGGHFPDLVEVDCIKYNPLHAPVDGRGHAHRDASGVGAR